MFKVAKIEFKMHISKFASGLRDKLIEILGKQKLILK